MYSNYKREIEYVDRYKQHIKQKYKVGIEPNISDDLIEAFELVTMNVPMTQ